MTPIRAFWALLKGIHFCLFFPSIRKYAMWPWIVGSLSYLASVFTAFKVHPILCASANPNYSGYWGTLVSGLVWLGVSLGLLVATLLVSVIVVMIVTGVFQSAIVSAVLSEIQGSAVANTQAETTTTAMILNEIIKHAWLIPLLVVVFMIGLIPFLTPFAIALGSWLLGYEFLDVVLDQKQFSARERFRFARQNKLALCCFGITLTIAWAVPFLGLLLAPAATAGATWLLSSVEKPVPGSNHDS